MSGSMRLVVDRPAAGASNMAVDEALLESSRDGRVTVRFYGFSPPCLSLGRNERARGRWDEVAAARAGVDIVRRPTGGRAVFHSAELTYAVCAPADLWGGLRESYRRIHRGLVEGLRELDVPVDSSRRRGRGARAGDGPAVPSCFTSPAAGEVVADGRKLVGSAQWRHRGALLQHGSLLLRDEQGRMRALRAAEAGARGAEGRGGAGRPGSSPAGGRAGAAAAAGGGAAVAGVVGPSGGGPGPSEGADGRSGVVATAGAGEGAETGAVGLQELMSALPPMDVLIRALARGLAGALGRKAERGALDAAEKARAAALEGRYRSRDWTWRR